jgi:hypothetical protein
MEMETPRASIAAESPRFIVVRDFFGGATTMRDAYDRHFATPFAQTFETHNVWNYWYVPQLYMYLSTEPAKVLGSEVVDHFRSALQDWSTRVLGLGRIVGPKLSLYVGGCGQGLHNDAGNGRWGFVFSLTRWKERRFDGGETILFKDVDHRVDAVVSGSSSADDKYHDLIEPNFNQLLVFDDRCLHGVRTMCGTMDPSSGRVILHGHISEEVDFADGIYVVGEQTRAAAVEALSVVQARVHQELRSAGDSLKGAVTVRATVGRGGNVSSLSVLGNRISRTREGGVPPQHALHTILANLEGLRFPAAPGTSEVTATFSVVASPV